jgi:uncharacterized SAM-binding protein YcdF (DUF218 family)
MYQLNELPDLLTPMPVYLLLIVAVIAWRSRRVVWWLAVVWVYVMSISFLASQAGQVLENRYRPIADLSPYEGYPVVVLSSGSVRLDPVLGWVNQVENSGWERLLTATRTAREVGGDLIIAGGSSGGPVAEPISATMRKAIQEMGGDLATVSVETQSSDTYENLANLRGRLAETPFILVTSATHMPRAMAVAEKLGLQPVAQPADYIASESVGVRSFVPTSEAILEWQIVLHELVGMAYYRLKGFL